VVNESDEPPRVDFVVEARWSGPNGVHGRLADKDPGGSSVSAANVLAEFVAKAEKAAPDVS
jgi:hypothetical protein